MIRLSPHAVDYRVEKAPPGSAAPCRMGVSGQDAGRRDGARRTLLREGGTPCVSGSFVLPSSPAQPRPRSRVPPRDGTLNAFTYGGDYPGTTNDFGQAAQFQQDQNCASPADGSPQYCATVLK